MISIVTAYQSQVQMTREWLNNIDQHRGGHQLEVILVNAGCPTLIEHPALTHRIDLPENISFSHSMNTGINAATGRYVVVMNNDCFPCHDWLDTLIRCQQESGAYVTSPEVSSPTLSCVGRVVSRTADYAIVTFYPAVCWMLSRECIDKVGLFDEQFVPTFFEDNDYAKRVKEAGGKFIVVTACQALHKRSQENSANLNMGEAYSENQRRYKQKWGDT